jgi:type VI secretion system protein ImpI
MIDRFDPAEIEREMETTGLMERLIAGGRSAKLWQLYTERYGEIAKAAEEQFLGEVGADFREAYETKGST